MVRRPPSGEKRRRRTVVYAWLRQINGYVILQPALEAGGPPLVDTRLEKLDRPGIHAHIQRLADTHGTPMKLVALREMDTMRIIRPNKKPPTPWRIISLLVSLVAPLG
jgi:hypothetical protein